MNNFFFFINNDIKYKKPFFIYLFKGQKVFKMMENIKIFLL